MKKQKSNLQLFHLNNELFHLDKVQFCNRTTYDNIYEVF
jgi:hypothetical protein